MTTSHILTDEEIGTLTVFDGLHHVETPILAEYVRAIESAVIAKLAERAVLPEPAYQLAMANGSAKACWIDIDETTFNSANLLPGQYQTRTTYTDDQMREAFAQGAASQLSAEPVAWAVKVRYGNQFIYDERMLDHIDKEVHASRKPLYTRKEPT